MIFVPVLYICVLEQCEFLQQQMFYQDKEQCKTLVDQKVQWYRSNTHAKVDGFCVDVFVNLRKPHES